MTPKARDRGVSETIGFVLTFSMVVLMVGLVYTAGMAALGDLQRAEQADNAEFAMEALGQSLETLERGDPARANELELGGGSLAYEDGVTMTVEVDGAAPVTYALDPNRVAYHREGTTVAYESGAVVRSRAGGATFAADPSFRCGADHAIVSVVSLTNVGDTSRIGSEGSVVVEARTEDHELLFPQDDTAVATDATKVTVTVTGEGKAAWNDYFTSESAWRPAPSGSGYVCDADSVHVRHTTVTVRLLG